MLLAVGRQESFLGPLPHPAHFAAYDETLPGAADRLLSMAEEQGRHRRRAETRGQWLAFLVGITVAGGGVLVASTGNPIPGTITTVSAPAVLLAVYVLASRQRDRD